MRVDAIPTAGDITHKIPMTHDTIELAEPDQDYGHGSVARTDDGTSGVVCSSIWETTRVKGHLLGMTEAHADQGAKRPVWWT